MPSVFTHTIVALTSGDIFKKPGVTWKFWFVSILCSSLPDMDVIAFQFGIPYGAFWGHRGFTHSLFFAAIVAVIVVVGLSYQLERPAPRKFRLFLYFFLLTASHGILDAMTDGGLGIAFFSPFDTTRYFLPWRPIPVCPIGNAFLSTWGLRVLWAEMVTVWLPCIVVWFVYQAIVRRTSEVSITETPQ